MKSERLQLGLTWNIRYAEIALVFLLMTAHVFNVQLLVLMVFGIACLFMLFSKDEETIDLLMFLTPFARLLMFQGKTLYFVMVGLFIFRFLLQQKVRKETFVFYVVLIMYCFVFCDLESKISFGNVAGLVFLFAIPVICELAKDLNYRKLMQHYILGFVLSTVIGFFAMDIPSIARLFEYDVIWTEEKQALTRYCGLAFDSNFYALSNYLIVAYLLLAFKKLDKYRALLVVFLIISGLQTVSKSYLLILGLLFVCYLVRTIPNLKQFVGSLVIVVLGAGLFAIISQKAGYNVIELVTDRFVVGGSLADNTTGRTEIWNTYIELFTNAGIKDFMFGYGFNAVVTRAAHNTFVEFLFFFGVVGCILWSSYFIYCWKVSCNTFKDQKYQSSMVLLCLILGIFFLSAYTYESFWVGITIAILSFKNTSKVRISI